MGMYGHYAEGEKKSALLYAGGAEIRLNGVLAAAVFEAGEDGRKLVDSAVIVLQITSGDDKDKWGPYDSEATDGRQTITKGKVCVLETGYELTLGDLPFAGLVANCAFNLDNLTLGGEPVGVNLEDLEAAMPSNIFRQPAAE